MNDESFGETLADLCAGFAALAPEACVVERLADALRCAGAAERVSDESDTALAKYRRLPPAAPTGAGATVWATGERVAAGSAALRNGIAVRLLDLNDTYVARSIVHPSDIIPALVAIAQDEQRPWERLLGGIQVGYEVTCRLAEVADLGSRGFEAATLSPLASALAAAWITGADRAVTVEAVRLAALDAATLACTRRGRLSDWKGMSSANGAAKGLFALELARAGVTAPADTFESPAGFLPRITGDAAVPADSASRLRRTLYKRYPAQIFVQVPLLLTEDLVRRGTVTAAAVERVTVHTAAVPARIVGTAGRTGPAGMTRETADHSLRFCLAAMLRYRRLSADDVDAALHDGEVAALMARIDVVEDEHYTAGYPDRLETRVEFALAGGRTLVVRGSAGEQLRRPCPAPQAEPSAATDWPFTLPGAAPPRPRANGDRTE